MLGTIWNTLNILKAVLDILEREHHWKNIAHTTDTTLKLRKWILYFNNVKYNLSVLFMF